MWLYGRNSDNYIIKFFSVGKTGETKTGVLD